MKLFVILCLLAFSAAEEDSQEQPQSENTPSIKPALGDAKGPQSTQQFPTQFPSSSLNLGNKDTVGNTPFPNFSSTFPGVQGNSDFFTAPQGALSSFPQGVSTGALPNFPQGVNTGALPNFSQGVPSGTLPNFPQGVSSGALPNFPQGITNGALPNFPQGITSGALPSFPQGIVSGAIPNFTTVPRTVLQGTPTSFHAPNTVLPSPVHPVISGLGNHFHGYTAGAYPNIHGTQGVGTFSSGNSGNVGLGHLGHYRVLPQETLSSFTTQGLHHQAIPTTGTLPTFTSGVFTPNQAVLKSPVTGTTSGGLNLQGLTTGNVQSEPAGTVFRRN